MSSRDSFERYYLEKVALGEGCGCAERVIRDPRTEIRSDDTLRAVAGALRRRWRRLRRRHAGGDGNVAE